MSEKSNHGGDRGLPTQPEEPNRARDDSVPTQHDGAQNNAAEADKVGRGHPPRDTRFRKGQPSPNPKGRPRKAQTMLPDLKKAIEQALNKKVRVSRGAKKVLMTRFDIGLERLLNKVAEGDRHAWRLLMDVANKVGVDFQARHKLALEEALAPSYQAILEDYLARRSDANFASTTAVLARPEPPDDDHAETTSPPRAKASTNTAPAPTPAAPPTAKTKPTSTAGSASRAEAKPAPSLAAAAPKPAASSATPSAQQTGHVLTSAGWLPAKIGTAPSEAKTATAREPTPAKDNGAPRLEPPLKPGVSYPKPFREMTPHAKRVWFPEWCAEHPECCEERAKFGGER
jgi:hypothetical protein